MLTIESVPEYTQLLNSGKLPADFVAYDKIDAIGAFESFIVLSDAYNSDYSSCMYGLVDSEGVRITLYIDSSDKTPSTADSVLSVNKANMRLLSGTGSGIYVSDDVKYQYVSGKLLSVSWENQGMIYTLCGTPMLSDYPHTASTFVGKMLNADMAKQTLNTAFGESAE